MIRDITISPLLNGFLLRAGCQQLAYTSAATMLADLSNYFADPDKTEKRILAAACNRKHTMPEPQIASDYNEREDNLRDQLAEIEAVRANILDRMNRLDTTTEAAVFDEACQLR